MFEIIEFVKTTARYLIELNFVKINIPDSDFDATTAESQCSHVHLKIDSTCQ